MNYKNIYENLIERGKNRTFLSYSERHHIIPRCMGGKDSKDNLVELTPEEHYLAHQLLVKIYPENFKLVFAVHRMCSGRNNKLYGWVRRRHAEAISIINSVKQKGEKNSQYGTSWYVKEGERKKFKRGEQPEGWISSVEFRRSNMKTSTNLKGRNWYNDGASNYLLHSNNVFVGLSLGRIGKLF